MEKYVFANWKMYLDHKEAVSLASELSKKIKKNDRVAIFPSLLSLLQVKEKLESKVSVGAQNCMWVSKGAYTGEVSALTLFDVGCKYVLVGHSERRHVFGETDDEIRKKLEAALDAGLIPVLCVGETQKEKNEEKTQYRIKEQLKKALEGLDVKADKIIFAYEPVWAIGTDVPCNPVDADDVQGWIKTEVKKYLNEDAVVLYGGSVHSDNVASFLDYEMIDGVLVGSDSVKCDEFLKIIEIANKK